MLGELNMGGAGGKKGIKAFGAPPVITTTTTTKKKEIVILLNQMYLKKSFTVDY